jgi:preprotein translocase subunit SecF
MSRYDPLGRELPDRRKHGYAELETKLNAHVESSRSQLHRFFNWGIAILAVVGLTTAASIFGFGIVLNQQGQQNNKIAEAQAQIQQQREDSIRSSCEDQNARHDNTVASFEQAAKSTIKKHPELAAQVHENVNTNLKIINALVPKQNCDQVVAESVKPVGNP